MSLQIIKSSILPVHKSTVGLAFLLQESML